LWLYEGIADYWELLYRRKILGQKSFEKRVTDLYDCFQKEEMVEEAAGCLFFVELEKMLGEAAVLEFLITLYQNHRDYLTIIDWERLIIELILDSFKWEYKNDLCCQRYV
jgi:hypothetical protein